MDDDNMDDDNMNDDNMDDDNNSINVGDWVGVRISINKKCRKNGPSQKLFFGKVIECGPNVDCGYFKGTVPKADIY